MIDFKNAIIEGVPPTQDKIDAARLDAEKKLSQFKQEVYWLLGVAISIPIFLIIVTKDFPAGFFSCAAVLVAMVFNSGVKDFKKQVSLYTEYSEVAKLIALKKKHGCGKAYFKALGEMGRTITKGEVEAMESQIKGISLSELKEEVYR